MKKILFEYGEGTLPAELPDSTEIFIPGETVADPPCITDVLDATRLSNPPPRWHAAHFRTGQAGNKSHHLLPGQGEGWFSGELAPQDQYSTFDRRMSQGRRARKISI